MNSRVPLLLLVISVSLSLTHAYQLSAAQLEIIHWHLLGTVGDLPVQMDLEVREHRVSGSYSYERTGGQLQLVGSHDSRGRLVLREFEDLVGDKGTGSLSLKALSLGRKAVFEGEWTSPDKKRRLPVKLRATVAYERVFQSAELPGLYVERPIFLDGFSSITEGRVLGEDTVAEDDEPFTLPVWDDEHGYEFRMNWHRPDIAISISRMGSENVGGASVGQGKADRWYEHRHYRLSGSKVSRIKLQDFFEAESSWEDLMPKQARITEEEDGFLDFTFDATGLTFHGSDARDQDRAKVSWFELEDVLRPGWPQALGIVPEVPFTEPAVGSALRKAILAAAAVPFLERVAEDGKKPSDYDLRWLVDDIRVKGEWALLVGEISVGLKDSYEVELLESEEDLRNRVILKREKTGWQVFKLIELTAPAEPWDEVLKDVPRAILQGAFDVGEGVQ